MAEDKRTLWSDIKKNILDVGLSGQVAGDTRGYGKKEIKKDLKSQEFPFRTKPKKKKKKDIETLTDFQRLLIETSERVARPKKKPVKYTSKGAFDAMSALGFVGIVPQAYTLDKLTKQQESKKFQRKRKYVEGYTDIATSLIRGTGNFVQSASEFVLTPIDYAFSTDFQTKFNKYMDDSLAFAPDEAESIPGTVSQLVAEYAIPVSAATKIKSGLMTWKKLKQLQAYNKTHKGSKILQREWERELSF